LFEIVTISDDDKVKRYEYFVNLILAKMGIEEVVWLSDDSCFSTFLFYDKECKKLSNWFNIKIKPNDNIVDIAEKLANIS